MNVFKKWARELLSPFVFLRFKSIWDLYDYLYRNKIDSGLNASVFTHYCDSHCSFIGIGAKFKGYPYLPHGLSNIFISKDSVIGKNCVIFQNVTIGSSNVSGSDHNGAPVIGDNCYIGSGAIIIGKVKVGNNCRIGANAVVYEDIPDNSVVVPGKTRIIQKDEVLDNRFLLNVEGEDEYFDFDSRTFKRF